MELAIASTSSAEQSPVGNYYQYPPPLASYEDIVASPCLFLDTLKMLHASMRTKFMIPIIGGQQLNLHLLFVEVTSRGGIEKVLKERRWREVTSMFYFPATATNASFVLRKYYGSLLYHYEQLYFFKAWGWTPISATAAPLQNPARKLAPAQTPAKMEERRAASLQHWQWPTITDAEPSGEKPTHANSTVMGVIDGKFDSGYLVTVRIGSEELRGVLFQAPQRHGSGFLHSVEQHKDSVATLLSSRPRRRRRKKNEIRKRDSSHPKSNRSAYNFFFSEQHMRLKPLHPGKDREISRMIGELWNNLTDSERAVYQEEAIRDKERYRLEMEDYREGLKTGNLSNVVPLQQWPPEQQDRDPVQGDIMTEESNSSGDPPRTAYGGRIPVGNDSIHEDKSTVKELSASSDTAATCVPLKREESGDGGREGNEEFKAKK